MKYFNYIRVSGSNSGNDVDTIIDSISSNKNVCDLKVHTRVNNDQVSLSFFTLDGTYQNELDKIQAGYDNVILHYISDKFSDNFGEVMYTHGKKTSSFNSKCPKFKFGDDIKTCNLPQHQLDVYLNIGTIFNFRVNKK